MKKQLLLQLAFLLVSCSIHKQSVVTTAIPETQLLKDTIVLQNPVVKNDSLVLEKVAYSYCFNLSNYELADKELAMEREKKIKAQQPDTLFDTLVVAKVDSCADTLTSTTKAADSATDSVASSFAVTLEDSTPEARAIDSINQIINTLQQDLFKNDRRMERIKTFDTPTTIEYMLFLRKNLFKNNDELQGATNILMAIKREEKVRTTIIMNSITGNNREIIHRYLKKINDEMAQLSDFLLQLASNEKIVIEHEKINPDFFANY